MLRVTLQIRFQDIEAEVVGQMSGRNSLPRLGIGDEDPSDEKGSGASDEKEETAAGGTYHWNRGNWGPAAGAFMVDDEGPASSAVLDKYAPPTGVQQRVVRCAQTVDRRGSVRGPQYCSRPIKRQIASQVRFIGH